jgi:VCBS repeat protein/FG-GAP repeat protein
MKSIAMAGALVAMIAPMGMASCMLDPADDAPDDLASATVRDLGAPAAAAMDPAASAAADSGGGDADDDDDDDGGAQVPARLVAPLSSATVTSSRPLLHWQVEGHPRRTRVDICRDRACAQVVTRMIAKDGNAQPSHGLAPGVYFWRAVRLHGHHPCAAPSATWSFRVPARPVAPAANSAWGLFLDVDGDGHADGAVRTINFDLPSHGFDVYLGGAAGLSGTADESVALTGDPPGVAISAAGDLNGDGYGELAVQHGGNVEVYSGGPGGLSTVPRVIPGTGNAFQYGQRIAAAGDIDGDGYGDLVITDFDAHLWIHRGGAAGVSLAPSWTIQAAPGESVIFAAAADFDGDRYGDLAITEFVQGSGTQQYRILRGSPSGPADRTSAPAFDSGLGLFGSAADIDADGYADLLLSERGIGVAIYRGGPAAPAGPPSARLAIDSDGFVAEPGDFDGNGHDDIAVTRMTRTDSFYFTLDRLVIHLASAAGVAATPSVELREEDYVGDIENNFGSVLSAADFDRDGRLDLLVGAAPPYPTPFFGDRPSLAFAFPGAATGVETAAQPTLSGLPGFGWRIAAGPGTP